MLIINVKIKTAVAKLPPKKPAMLSSNQPSGLFIKLNKVFIYTPIHSDENHRWLFLIFLRFSGTGSYPPLHSGLHLKIRQRASAEPLIAPCVPIASIAYCEQEGINRQQGILSGEIFFWYSLINLINNLLILRLTQISIFKNL